MRHEVKAVTIGEIAKHPNADTLGITEIDGYTVIVRLGEWSSGDVGVYVEPDYVVPEAPWSAFLGDSPSKRRIRVKKLRGVYSQGLLLKPEVLGISPSPGDDVMDALGIVRWEPPEPGEGSGSRIPSGETPHPSLALLSKYDLESWQKYQHAIPSGTKVYITEKIHGENARFAWVGGRMWVGSRNRWIAPGDGGNHWKTLECNPWIESWCRDHEHHVLFGESFGGMPGMTYGVAPGERGFLAFDAYDTVSQNWYDADIFNSLSIPRAPLLFVGAIEDVDPKVLAEGVTTIGARNHVREGCVIKPAFDMWSPRIGRVALKCVGNGYLEKGA